MFTGISAWQTFWDDRARPRETSLNHAYKNARATGDGAHTSDRIEDQPVPMHARDPSFRAHGLLARELRCVPHISARNLSTPRTRCAPLSACISEWELVGREGGSSIL